MGRLVSQLPERTLSGGTHTLDFPTSGLPAGHYFCTLLTRSGGPIARQQVILTN